MSQSVSAITTYRHSDECRDYRHTYLADRPGGDPPCICSPSYRLNEEKRNRLNAEALRVRR